ncbi:VOC family protein [Pseudonocardiaceae bacterium YIM PH 21723]|nr:VOC family protein [Pseudonocardiaceae bacterium YIM PH 21723]
MAVNIGMVTFDTTDPRRLAEFWRAALDTKVEIDAEGYFISLEPVGDGPALGFQKVTDPTPGKNRVHLDVSGGRPEVERLAGLGATVVGDQEVPGFSWTVMADPDGNQFCVGHGVS